MEFRRAWLVAAEGVALAIFFYCAVIAKNLYIEISEFHEFDSDEELVLMFVAWHTYAREAFCAVVFLWLVAIAIAIFQYTKVRKSQSDFLVYRPVGPTAVAIGLPVVGVLAGCVFNLFLPGL
jgi:hypothetical protein